MDFRFSCLHFPMPVLHLACQVPLVLACIFHPAPNEQQEFQNQKWKPNRPFNKDPCGMIKTERVLGRTKTEHRNEVFVFPSNTSALLFSINSANLTLTVSLYHERIQKSGFTASCVMYYTSDQLHHSKNKCTVEVTLQPSNLSSWEKCVYNMSMFS